MASIFLISFGSCSDDDAQLAPLKIDSVSKAMSSSKPVNPAHNDSLTSVGYAGVMYIIKGSGFSGLQKIYFNGKESYFNPALVTDNTIFVTIDQNTPFENVSNELKLVTKGGTVVYPFKINAPAPVISRASTAFASPGDIITLYGDNFVSIKSVKFNNTEAEIEGTPTRYEMRVKVPADFGTYGVVVVETEFGVSKPSSIGVKYLFYGDSLPSWAYDWGGSYDAQSTENVSRGTYSIKKVAEPWSGFFMNSDLVLDTADYQLLKMSVYSTESTKIFITINSETGNTSKGTTVTLIPGTWNNISIPISDLHPESLDGGTFNNVFIQEFSNIPLTSDNIIYIDDIGFL